MTPGTEGLINLGTVLRVAGSFRYKGRRVGTAKIARWSPGAESANQRIDLFVGEHSSGALCECGHRGATHSVRGCVANRRVVSDCQENRIAQSITRPAASATAVASRAILRIENVELQNVIRGDNFGVWSRTSG